MTQSINTAIYCRLSRDDGNEESQSIAAQKAILTEYVNNQGWNIYDIYIDDGYSGTNFDRPDFIRLINDIEIGKINIVVTKDLSRLGRNYIQTGYYTEEYFPSKDVRYIAVNDSFDTKNEDSNDFAPFKNIINEWYAKDISKKIRFTLDNKAKNGEPKNTVFPIFGYKYNEKFERIPDPETAPIVKLIFKMYKESYSSVKIAKYLRENHYKLPCYYNAVKFNYNKTNVLNRSDEQLENWTPQAVRKILQRIEYTGTYITAQSKSKNFKSKIRDRNNPDKYIFEKRYEALVDEETFNTVNNMLMTSRSGLIPVEINKFKGLVFCAKCGERLKFYHNRSKCKTEVRYNSHYYCTNKKTNCQNSISLEILSKFVLNDLLLLKKNILNHKEEFIELSKKFDKRGRNIKINKNDDIDRYKKRYDELDKYIQALFEQNVNGRVPESTYQMMMDKYIKEKNHIEEQIKNLVREEQINLVCPQFELQSNQFIELLENISEEDMLNPDVLRKIITKINIECIERKANGTKNTYRIKIGYGKIDNLIEEFKNEGFK